MGAAADAALKKVKSGGSASRAASRDRASKYAHPTGGASGKTFLATQAPKVKQTGVWTPIQAGFDWLSRPAYVVGNIAAGRPVEAAKNALNFVQPHTAASSKLAGERAFLSESLKRWGVLPEGKLGTVLGFGADVLTDPLTYATGGVGAAATAPVKAARAAAQAEIKALTAAGKRATPAEIGRITAPVRAAEAEAPRRASIGFRVPFSGGKVIGEVGSTKIPEFFSRAGNKTPRRVEDAGEWISKGVGTGRGAGRFGSKLYQDIRTNAETWRNSLLRDIRHLNYEAEKTGKALGLKWGEAGAKITKHIGAADPTPLPPGLAELAERAKSIRDQINELEIAAGVEKGQRSNYVPFLAAGKRDQKALKQALGPEGAGYLDNPFFTKTSKAKTLAEFIALGEKHGFTPELNIAKLLERRMEASIKALEKKSIDDAFAAQYAGKAPLEEVPDVAPVKAKLEAEQARLAQLTGRKGAGAEKSAAAEARKNLTAAHAAVRAAQRTGDPNLVQAARADLGSAREAVFTAPDVAAQNVAQAERYSRYFDPAGKPPPELTSEIDRVAASAKRAVTRQEKRLVKAKKSKSKPAIRDAEAALRRARASERRAAIALAVAREARGGHPRNIVAQVKRTQKAERQLAKVERKAGAVELANARAQARPGEFFPTKEAYEEALSTWRQIGDATKYHDGTLLPPKIADELDRIHDAITSTVKSEEGLAQVGRFMTNLGSRWKSLALLSPGYHIRNQIDDGFRAWVAGARNPAVYAQAAAIIRKPHALNPAAANEVIEAGGKVYDFGKAGNMDRQQALSELETMGIIDTGQIRADIQSQMDEWIKRHPGLGRGRVSQASAELGLYRENVMRAFTYLSLRKKGLSQIDAADQTRAALFDYGQVGKFVESARRFWIPFITYPSKAIPWTAKTAVTRPGVLANTYKAMLASNELAGDPDLSQLPPWIQSGFAVPAPAWFKELIQAPADQPLILNPERVTAWASLNLLDPRPREAVRNILGGMANPLATVPAETLTGYDFFFGRESARRSKQGAAEKLWTGIGLPLPDEGPKQDLYTGREVPGYATWLNKWLGLLPAHGQASYAIPGGGSESSRLGPFKYATGLPVSPYDKAKAEFYANRFRD